jgi:hypothetical protein
MGKHGRGKNNCGFAGLARSGTVAENAKGPRQQR